MRVAIVSFTVSFAIAIAIVIVLASRRVDAPRSIDRPSLIVPAMTEDGAASTAIASRAEQSSAAPQVGASDPRELDSDPVLAGVLAITFIAANGESVSDVEVTVAAASGATRRARSDAEGSAVIEGLVATTYQLRLRVGGRTLRGEKLIEIRDAERVALSVGIPTFDHSIDGIVLDDSGAPCAAASVEARLVEPFITTDLPLVPQSAATVVRASTTGRFELADLQDGEYELRVDAGDGRAPTLFPAVAGDRDIEVLLPRGRLFTLRGSVTSDSRPLRFARIEAAGAPSATTGPDGRFELAFRVPDVASSWNVSITCPGHAAARVTLTDESLAAGEAEIAIALEPVAKIAEVSGRVIGSDGAGLVGEWVRLHSTRDGTRYEARSRADGRFTFHGVPIGDGYRLAVLPISYHRDHRIDALEVPAEGVELDIALEPLQVGRIRGLCVDPRGSPLAGQVLRVRSAISTGIAIEFRCDDRGRFDVDRVPEGRLHFESDHFGRHRVRAGELAGGAVLDLVLPIDLGERTLAGRIADASGEPVAGATVTLRTLLDAPGASSSSFRSARTDGAGRFAFARTGAAAHTLLVDCPGFERREIEIAAGEGAGDVRLETDSGRQGAPKENGAGATVGR